MCGRYASDLPPDLIGRLFATVNPLPEVRPSWNVPPSATAMVVRRHPETRQRHLDLLTWGLLPHWTRDAATARRPINARAETVTSLPAFRAAYAARRCLAPARAFYEWRRTRSGKQPFAFARTDGMPLALAGLWEGYRWPSGEVSRTFCIITVPANDTVRQVHDRAPAILEPADWPVWLGEVAGDYGALLRPAAGDVLQVWPVGLAVSSTHNDRPDLLDPLPGWPE